MYLLGIGETLEEWTHKKSVDDLARSMSLNVSKVWLLQDGQGNSGFGEEVALGDSVVVRMGNVIPFDGVIRQGEAMVNQASMTGESLPVRKEVGYIRLRRYGCGGRRNRFTGQRNERLHTV